nr:MAG TPA: hypothetical protein [Caudoviricetes sp.]
MRFFEILIKISLVYRSHAVYNTKCTVHLCYSTASLNAVCGSL